MGEGREIEKKQPRLGELIKYGAQGFVFGSVTRFFNHQLYTNPGSLVRDGFAAAGRMGMVAAFRTPLFVCIERSVAASRGQTDYVSFLGALFASYLSFRLPAGAMLASRVPTNYPSLLSASLVTFLPFPITPGSTLHAGGGGSLYMLFLWSLIREQNQRRRRNVVPDHGFIPEFLQDFS